MDSNQHPVGDQTASEPIEPTTTTVVEQPKKKRNLLPIIIAVIAIVAAVAIVVLAITISGQNKKGQNGDASGDDTQGKEQTQEPGTETEFAAKDRLAEKGYTIDDLNNGITLDLEGDYTFKSSAYVTFASANKNTPNLLATVDVAHENLTPTKVGIYTENSNIYDLDKKCSNTKNCVSDYIDGAKTLLIATATDKETNYSFYSKTNDKLLRYSTTVAKNTDIKESTIRNILIKAAMTMSGPSKNPYIYDLAAKLKLPNQKRVKSYKDISMINSDSIQITLTNESGNTTYILVYQKPIQGVAVSEISSDPKIGGFTQNKQPFFRFYDGDDALDVSIAKRDSKGSNFISDLKKVQEIIDKIDE